MIPRRMHNNKTRKDRKGLKRPGDKGMPIIVALTHPPMIQPQIRHFQRLRFVVNGGVNNASFTFTNLLDAILVATGATVGYQVFDQVKIKFVELWVSPLQGSAANTAALTSVTVTWPGSDGDARVISDTAMGSEPAHVMTLPSKLSLAAFWNGPSATTAFQLICSVGAVVDVGVAYRNSDSAPVAVANPLVGATVGQFYYRGLDGLAVATTKFGPVAPLTQ
jgi:hypothetical protein